METCNFYYEQRYRHCDEPAKFFYRATDFSIGYTTLGGGVGCVEILGARCQSHRGQLLPVGYNEITLEEYIIRLVMKA